MSVKRRWLLVQGSGQGQHPCGSPWIMNMFLATAVQLLYQNHQTPTMYNSISRTIHGSRDQQLPGHLHPENRTEIEEIACMRTYIVSMAHPCEVSSHQLHRTLVEPSITRAEHRKTATSSAGTAYRIRKHNHKEWYASGRKAVISPRIYRNSRIAIR